jgi:hypothetical protein
MRLHFPRLSELDGSLTARSNSRERDGSRNKSSPRNISRIECGARASTIIAGASIQRWACQREIDRERERERERSGRNKEERLIYETGRASAEEGERDRSPGKEEFAVSPAADDLTL